MCSCQVMVAQINFQEQSEPAQTLSAKSIILTNNCGAGSEFQIKWANPFTQKKKFNYIGLVVRRANLVKIAE